MGEPWGRAAKGVMPYLFFKLATMLTRSRDFLDRFRRTSCIQANSIRVNIHGLGCHGNLLSIGFAGTSPKAKVGELLPQYAAAGASVNRRITAIAKEKSANSA